MTSNSATATPVRAIFRRASAREIAILLFVAWLVPFAVHLAPWSGEKPLGASLLPMFWTAFVAGYFFGLRTAVLVALFAPALNLLITGLPALTFLSTLALELMVFSLATTWAVRRMPRLVLIAPLGYTVARLIVCGLRAATDPANARAYADGFGHSLAGGAVGLVLLFALNAALAWFYPKERLPA
ncbi:MAG: hypothetical protein RIQ93_1725 [Verrucomicrobiota bacterium]|jgi:hypothetical protein